MEDAKSITTPIEASLTLIKYDGKKVVDSTLYRSLVGGLMHLTTTRLDLTPRDAHWESGKRILRYVKGTQNHGLHYYKAKNSSLVHFCDSDCAGSIDNCKSTSGYVFNISFSTVSWSSNKSSVVTLSTVEVENITLAATDCQVRWWRWILEELNHEQE